MSDADFPLTPGERTYGRDPSLTRLPDGRTALAWIESRMAGADISEQVALRAVDADGPGPMLLVEPLAGAPARPRLCGGLLVWREMRDAVGTLVCAPVDLRRTALVARPRVIPMDRANCGEFAAALSPEGDPCLAFEDWDGDRVALRAAAFQRGAWGEMTLSAAAWFRNYRPALAASADELRLAFNHERGAWCGTAVLTAGASLTDAVLNPAATLALPRDHGDSTPALGATAGGEWYAARFRERPVVIENGVVTWHSELVVSHEIDGAWHDVAAVDVDHGMNPWLGAYVGRRRIPHLVAGDDTVWVLWEEKEDPTLRRQSVGRLCAVEVGPEGVRRGPVVAHRGEAMYVVEQGARPDDVLVATRPQPREGDQRLPWLGRRVDLTAADTPRPADVESNAGAPHVLSAIGRLRPPHWRDREREGDWGLFFGDPHLHSRLSGDLDGEIDELYRYAREVAGLDFAAVTDNDFHWLTEPLSPAAWEETRRASAAFDARHIFTALLGWEYTRHRGPDEEGGVDSHRTVLAPDDDLEVLTWHEGYVDTPADLARRLRGRRVLLHHHQPMGYDVTDDTLERNIEVCSGWWNCMKSPGFVENLHRMLAEGHRLGFFGASDNHERNPGLGGALAGVWARENTREGIFEAFEARRVYATTGRRAVLRFRVGGEFMGGETACEAGPEVEVAVKCDVPIRGIEIVRDGEVVHSEDGDGRCEQALTWTDPDCPPGRHWYYAHVEFDCEEAELYWNVAPALGAHAWSSPVWVDRD